MPRPVPKPIVNLDREPDERRERGKGWEIAGDCSKDGEHAGPIQDALDRVSMFLYKGSHDQGPYEIKLVLYGPTGLIVKNVPSRIVGAPPGAVE